jgi:hypothetical protein
LYWAFFSLAPALLEERIVSFEDTTDSVPLHDATIVYSADDPVGLDIAATSLADDLKAITGKRPAVIKLGVGDCASCTNNVIIAATANSTLIKTLMQDGKLDIALIDGKWESYFTSVVENPMPGIQNALVIVGSDKRGAMFGIYTLSEQCGQSP